MLVLILKGFEGSCEFNIPYYARITVLKVKGNRSANINENNYFNAN